MYGPCRLDHGEATRCCFKKTLPGSVLYVGLEVEDANGGKYKHRLVRFSSAQLSRGVHVLEPPGRKLVCAWALGMIMDSNQSKDMVTVMVNVSPIRTVDDLTDPKQVDPTRVYTKEGKVYARRSDDARWWQEKQTEFEIKPLSAAQQLAKKWFAPESRLAAPPTPSDWH